MDWWYYDNFLVDTENLDATDTSSWNVLKGEYFVIVVLNAFVILVHKELSKVAAGYSSTLIRNIFISCLSLWIKKVLKPVCNIEKNKTKKRKNKNEMKSAITIIVESIKKH